MENKYSKLFKYIKKENRDYLKLSYEEIEKINGIGLDHSFLKCKNELINDGFKVSKISMKDSYVEFVKEDKGY